MDTRTKVGGEQWDYYDPLFIYNEDDEANYFVISNESEAGAADVGPSSAGGDKEIPMASSSREWVVEPMASEGKPDIPATEAFRTDEVLPEIAYGAFPATARISFTEPTGVSTAVEGALGDIVVETVGAVSVMTSPPLGNIIVICKQSFFDIIILLSLF